MADVPDVVHHGTVVGNLVAFLADTADPDRRPDEVGLDGYVTLIPTTRVMRFPDTVPPRVAVVREERCPVYNGILYPPHITKDTVDSADQGVVVVATEQPAGLPDKVYWTAVFRLEGVVNQPPNVTFEVPINGTVDLAHVLPTTPEPGTVRIVSTEDRVRAEAAASEAEAALDDLRSESSTIIASAVEQNTASLTGTFVTFSGVKDAAAQALAEDPTVRDAATTAVSTAATGLDLVRASTMPGGVDGGTRRTLQDGTLLDPTNDAAPWSRYILNGTTVAGGPDVDPEHGRYLWFTTGTTNPARIMRSVGSLDLSNSFVSYWLRVNDTNITRFETVLGTRTTNMAQSVQDGGPNIAPAQLVPGRWNRITVDLPGDVYRWNAPPVDDNAVRDLGFYVSTNGSAASFDVAGIRVHSRANQGSKIIWQFDDASIETYTTAYPILAEHGFVGSIPVEADAVGTSGRMSVAQLQEVYDAGWEICGHYSQQIPPMDEAGQRAAFEQMKALNANNGWERGANFMIWPGGIWSEQAEAVAFDYFTHLRRVASMGLATTPWVTNQFAIPLGYITSANGAFTEAKRESMTRMRDANGSRLYVFHEIVPSGATAEAVNEADFRARVEYAAELGIGSATLTDFYGSGR